MTTQKNSVAAPPAPITKADPDNNEEDEEEPGEPIAKEENSSASAAIVTKPKKKPAPKKSRLAPESDSEEENDEGNLKTEGAAGAPATSRPTTLQSEARKALILEHLAKDPFHIVAAVDLRRAIRESEGL